MTLVSVGEITARLNAMAESLAPKLLPNGHRSGNFWMASGIDDSGASASLYVHLAGDKIGHWSDAGNARAGEEFGDMLDLLRLKRGLASVAEAVQEAKTMLGIVDTPRQHGRMTNDERRTREENREYYARLSAQALAERQQREADELALRIKRAKGLYLSGRMIDATPAEHYLRARWLEPATVAGHDGPTWPSVLRYHPDVWCRAERAKLPAMLAAFYLADGRQVAVHRTFLMLDRERGWVKIDSPEAKTILGPYGGGFIPICKGASGKSMRHMNPDERVYVTEGIEDALVCRIVRPQYRIICAGTLPNMGAIVLPEQAKRLAIVCDRDTNEQAQNQLERVIARHQARGLTVELAMPPPGIKDYNAWWIELRRAEKRERG
jgi:hypothetical protein